MVRTMYHYSPNGGQPHVHHPPFTFNLAMCPSHHHHLRMQSKSWDRVTRIEKEEGKKNVGSMVHLKVILACSQGKAFVRKNLQHDLRNRASIHMVWRGSRRRLPLERRVVCCNEL